MLSLLAREKVNCQDILLLSRLGTDLVVVCQIYVNEVVLGTAFGIFMGPYFADIFNPRNWGNHYQTVTLEVMRIVLATGLFAIGVELPKSYMARHAKSLLAMVVPTMAIGWVIVAGTLRSSILLEGGRSPPLSTRFTPRNLPESLLHILPGYLGMLDAYGPHHLRRHCWCVRRPPSSRTFILTLLQEENSPGSTSPSTSGKSCLLSLQRTMVLRTLS